MSAEQIDSYCEEVAQLKTQFESLQGELIAKLNEFGNRIDSAERLNQEADASVTNLEDPLANVSNDAKEWQEIMVKLASTAVKGKVILDVGGDKYTTTVETLMLEKNSYFTAMFSHRWELQRDPKDDSIFIDRDGKLFAHILAYLRTDFVPSEILTNESLREKLVLEAKYFQLHKLLEILTGRERGTLVSIKQQKILAGFCGSTQFKWELLYRASRDGFDASAFHSRCDNKGPTLTIIRSNNNHLFGGYTSVAWTTLGNYAADSKAFLFTLTNLNNIPPTKYPIQSSKIKHSIDHQSGCGPTFGGGHDLLVCSNSNSNNSSYTQFPTSYTDTTGHGNNTFTGSRKFTTSDIEVFKLT